MFIVYESELCNCLFCPLSTKHFGDKMVLWRIKQIALLSNNNGRMNTKTSRDCAITQWWEIEYTTRKREWVVAGIIYLKKKKMIVVFMLYSFTWTTQCTLMRTIVWKFTKSFVQLKSYIMQKSASTWLSLKQKTRRRWWFEYDETPKNARQDFLGKIKGNDKRQMQVATMSV